MQKYNNNDFALPICVPECKVFLHKVTVYYGYYYGKYLGYFGDYVEIVHKKLQAYVVDHHRTADNQKITSQLHVCLALGLHKNDILIEPKTGKKHYRKLDKI